MVKRWGKSPPRTGQPGRYGKPHPEQCRIGASRGKVRANRRKAEFRKPPQGRFSPEARVGSLTALVTGAAEEWSSRGRRRKAGPLDRIRLIGHPRISTTDRRSRARHRLPAVRCFLLPRAAVLARIRQGDRQCRNKGRAGHVPGHGWCSGGREGDATVRRARRPRRACSSARSDRFRGWPRPRSPRVRALSSICMTTMKPTGRFRKRATRPSWPPSSSRRAISSFWRSG